MARGATRSHTTLVPSSLTALLPRARVATIPIVAAAASATAAVALAAATAAAATRRRHRTAPTTTSPTGDPPPTPDTTPSGEGPSRYERAVSAGLRACARESHAYGRCAAGYLPDAAPKGACEREFLALRRCFLAASGLDRWRQRRQAAEEEGEEEIHGGRPDRAA